MSDLSPRLSMPFLLPAQAQKHVTHNEALSRLDALVQAAALSRGLTEPPASVQAGDCYVLPANPTGVWAGRAHALAVHDGVAWTFLAPRPGWRVHVTGEGVGLVWTGSAWTVDRPPLDNLDGVGIGATHDATNRLAVAAQATLLTHAGGSHQVKVNKAAPGDTASLLFQTGWSGRAEMGIAGSDAFAIKVSADSDAWTTALSLDPVTGQATGAAVQTGPTDTTPGRLMRTDFGYGRGNILGPVAMSGGTPTGAVMEQGQTANGDYLRLADGTQICQHEIALAFVNSTICTATWTFPAAFAPGSKPQVLGSVNTLWMMSSAPGVPANGICAMTIGTLSTTSAALQVRTLPGQSFQSGHTVLMRAVATGRWL